MELLAALLGAGLAFLFGRRKKKAAYTVRPWGKNVLTVALWSGMTRPEYTDGPPGSGTLVPNARTLQPHEASMIRAGVDSWNTALSQAGVPLRLELVTDQSADILIYGSDGLPGRKSGHTVTYVASIDTPAQTVMRATIALAQVAIFAHELGHALGIDGHTDKGLMAPETRSIVPSVADARLLLAAYPERTSL